MLVMFGLRFTSGRPNRWCFMLRTSCSTWKSLRPSFGSVIHWKRHSCASVSMLMSSRSLRHVLRFRASVREALFQLLEVRHDEAGGAAQALRRARHGAAGHVHLGAVEVEPDVRETGENIRVARTAQSHHVEEHGETLVVYAAVEVLEVDDVADVLRRAVILLHLLGCVHGVSL